MWITACADKLNKNGDDQKNFHFVMYFFPRKGIIVQ